LTGRESLASEVGLSIKQHEVIELLRYLFLVRGSPACIRSDNGPEFVAQAVRQGRVRVDEGQDVDRQVNR